MWNSENIKSKKNQVCVILKRTVARVFRSLFRVKITRYMVYLFKGLKKFWNFFRFFQNYSIAQIKNGVWPRSQRPLLNVNAQPNILLSQIVPLQPVRGRYNLPWIIVLLYLCYHQLRSLTVSAYSTTTTPACMFCKLFKQKHCIYHHFSLFFKNKINLPFATA